MDEQPDSSTRDEKPAAEAHDGHRFTLEELNTTYSTEEVAEKLGVRPSTLHNARWKGNEAFPPFVKIGGRVRYRAVDVYRFLREQTRQGASGDG